MGSLAARRRVGVGGKQRKEEWGCQPVAGQERVTAALTDAERTAIFAKRTDVDLTGFANKVW